MSKELSKEEQEYLYDILEREHEQGRLAVFSNIFLLVGCILIVATMIYLYQHLVDKAVYWIGLPGILMGIVLILLYVILMKRTRENKIIISILKKLVNKE
ncbi:MAG: hypothetical protein ISS81_01235 [Candidatus Marinimicrobia bacterium]|nr:hypothetical protein [Candidatus Neomarinimicrobiota bacterium]